MKKKRDLKILKIEKPCIIYEIDAAGFVANLKKNWPSHWRKLARIRQWNVKFTNDTLEFPDQGISIGIEELERLSIWKAPMKLFSIRIVEDWVVEAAFEDGTVRRADVREIPFDGVFLRVKTDLEFFRTAHEDGFCPCWGDYTLDPDFLHRHSSIINRSNWKV